MEALNNQPGIFSARYFSKNATDQENLDFLLKNLNDKKNRKARFVSVICLIINQKEYFFEGEIRGEITFEPKGNFGFGYDPVFQPDGFETTFAEMNQLEKTTISHRGIATRKFVAFLKIEIK